MTFVSEQGSLQNIFINFILAMDSVPEEVTCDIMADSSLFGKYIGDQRGIQGHQNSCYLDAILFGLFALSSCFDELFLYWGYTKSNETIKSIIWKKIVNPLRRYYSNKIVI